MAIEREFRKPERVSGVAEVIKTKILLKLREGKSAGFAISRTDAGEPETLTFKNGPSSVSVPLHEMYAALGVVAPERSSSAPEYLYDEAAESILDKVDQLKLRMDTLPDGLIRVRRLAPLAEAITVGSHSLAAYVIEVCYRDGKELVPHKKIVLFTTS